MAECRSGRAGGNTEGVGGKKIKKKSTRINVNTLPENTRKYFEIEYVDIGNVILKKEYTRPKNSFLKMHHLEPGDLHMRAIQSFLRSGLT